MAWLVIRMVALAAIFGLAFSAAQAVPGNCIEPRNRAEKVLCGQQELAALDKEVTRLVRLVRKGVPLMSAHRRELAAAQRGWLGRQGDCWKSKDRSRCVRDSYLVRIHALRRDNASARSEDANGISRGPFVFTCTGMDAPLSASFINIDPGTAYLEWGGRALILTQARSGPGARYVAVADVGETTFWSRGREALLGLPGNPDRTCTQNPG